jgi:hypothetical protein
MNRITYFVSALAATAFAVAVSAKLPPPSEEAKAKAAEAAAKAAYAAKVGAYKLCKSMDKVAAEYYAAARRAGKKTNPPTPTPACVEPGPFAAAPAAAGPAKK